MNPQNPYEPPRALDQGAVSLDTADAGAVPAAILEAMRQTKPWVTFLSILGFVMTGFMLLAALALLIMGGLGKLPGITGAMGIAVPAIYLVLALLSIAPSLSLFRYGAEIQRLLNGGGMHRLIQALVRQKSFWRLIGILTLIVMGMYALAFVGIAATAAQHGPTP